MGVGLLDEQKSRKPAETRASGPGAVGELKSSTSKPVEVLASRQCSTGGECGVKSSTAKSVRWLASGQCLTGGVECLKLEEFKKSIEDRSRYDICEIFSPPGYASWPMTMDSGEGGHWTWRLVIPSREGVTTCEIPKTKRRSRRC